MNTSFPSSDLVVPELAGFLRLAGEALDTGTALARNHYEQRKGQLENELASMITRSGAKAVMKKRGLDTDDLETVDLPLVGLRVVVQSPFRKYRIAIWKSPDEDIPAPGRSRGRQYFLRRNQLSLALDIPWQENEINLVLTWNVSLEFYLTDLFLHMPSSTAESFYKSPQSYWSERVPLPAEFPNVDQNQTGDDEVEDLPYMKADEDEEEGGAGDLE
ncbi:MAG: hypothetical protein IH865_01775 [Chloroflexi bacterium]|nr:hypothetical protein [Chloroflexota bacterium]